MYVVLVVLSLKYKIIYNFNNLVTKTEHTRMNHIINWLTTEGTINELNLRDRLGLGMSTYQQLKREAKLRYPWKIRIESKRGEEDRWSLILGEEVALQEL